MFDDEESEESESKPDPLQWSWICFWSVIVFHMGQWFKLCYSVFHDFSIMMDRHDDWKRGQKDFQRQASLEIEALTREIQNERPKARRRARA